MTESLTQFSGISKETKGKDQNMEKPGTLKYSLPFYSKF